MYLRKLLENIKLPKNKLRKIINNNISEVLEEVMSYRKIGYLITHLFNKRTIIVYQN